jgi:DNA-binding transcriptional LysR family regulator
MDLTTFLNLGHVVTMYGSSRMTSFEDWALKQKKFRRKVEVSVASFAQVPPLLVGTNRLATVHRKLAEQMVERYPLKLFDPPFKMPKIDLSIQWHSSTESDDAVQWVLQKLIDLAKD